VREKAADRWRPQNPLRKIVVKRDERSVDEDAQPLAVVHERTQRLGLAGQVREDDQFTLGLHEQGVDRPLQRGLRRVERRRLALATRIVMLQPISVQPVDLRDPLDPPLAPLRQLRLPGGGLDKIAAHMTPAVR